MGLLGFKASGFKPRVQGLLGPRLAFEVLVYRICGVWFGMQECLPLKNTKRCSASPSDMASAMNKQ